MNLLTYNNFPLLFVVGFVLFVVLFSIAAIKASWYSRTSLQRDSEKRSDSQRRSFRWERSSIRMSVIDFKL